MSPSTIAPLLLPGNQSGSQTGKQCEGNSLSTGTSKFIANRGFVYSSIITWKRCNLNIERKKLSSMQFLPSHDHSSMLLHHFTIKWYKIMLFIWLYLSWMTNLWLEGNTVLAHTQELRTHVGGLSHWRSVTKYKMQYFNIKTKYFGPVTTLYS